jgi:hypothetical protein
MGGLRPCEQSKIEPPNLILQTAQKNPQGLIVVPLERMDGWVGTDGWGRLSGIG